MKHPLGTFGVPAELIRLIEQGVAHVLPKTPAAFTEARGLMRHAASVAFTGLTAWKAGGKDEARRCLMIALQAENRALRLTIRDRDMQRITTPDARGKGSPADARDKRLAGAVADILDAGLAGDEGDAVQMLPEHAPEVWQEVRHLSARPLQRALKKGKSGL